MNAAVKPSSGEIRQAIRNGKLAANYYGFTCDWCWQKGSTISGWYDNRSSETHYIRCFSRTGAEIRVCMACHNKLKKRWWICC